MVVKTEKGNKNKQIHSKLNECSGVCIWSLCNWCLSLRMAKHWIAGNFLGAQVDWMVYTLSSLISIVFATNDWDLAGPLSTPSNQHTTLSLHAPGRNRRNNMCRSFYVHERKKKRKRDISLSFLDRLFIILSVILSWVFFSLFLEWSIWA